VHALARMLCHVPSIGLIVQPHRVAVPFFGVAMAEQLCSNPWRNNFVEGKTCDHPSKMTQE